MSMETHKMLNLFLAQNEDFKIVKVVFPSSSKRYTYKTTLNIEAGDKVIVDSPRDGMTVVDVVDVVPGIETDLQYSFNLKWIVQKVDTTHYEQALEMEAKLNTEFNKIKARKARQEMLESVTEQLGKDAVKELTKLVRL